MKDRARSRHTKDTKKPQKAGVKTSEIERLLKLLLRNQRRILRALYLDKQRDKAMARTIEETVAAVREQTTVGEGLAKAFDGLQDVIKNQVKGLTPEQQAGIDEIFDKATAAKATYEKALLENTDEGGSTGGIGGSTGGV